MLVTWMMVTRSLSVTEAMAELQRLRPVTRPNDGFIRQLRLFKAMGCRVDTESSRYRYFSISSNFSDRLLKSSFHVSFRGLHGRLAPFPLPFFSHNKNRLLNVQTPSLQKRYCVKWIKTLRKLSFLFQTRKICEGSEEI